MIFRRVPTSVATSRVEHVVYPKAIGRSVCLEAAASTSRQRLSRSGSWEKPHTFPRDNT
jgi:hypothetical protein